MKLVQWHDDILNTELIQLNETLAIWPVSSISSLGKKNFKFSIEYSIGFLPIVFYRIFYRIFVYSFL